MKIGNSHNGQKLSKYNLNLEFSKIVGRFHLGFHLHFTFYLLSLIYLNKL